MRIATTLSTVWSVDEEKKEFNRSPRIPNTEHPYVKYTGEWEPYETFQEVEYGGKNFLTFTLPGGDFLRSGYLTEEGE